MLAVLIKSIEVNHTSNEGIHIYIVDDGINARNKLKIINSINQEKIKLTWLPINEIIPKDIAFPLDKTTFPLNIYIRLFIPHFLPQACVKAIYLDVDMVVKKDISLLWNTNINGKTIAGVVDRSEKVSSTWAGITNYKELGLHPDTKYFNSGLLVIDLNKWRQTTLSLDILKCIHKNQKFADFPDQYGLNVIFANQWFELDHRWNTFATMTEKDPYIIHFIGRKPIYSSYVNNNSYAADFFQYMKLTKWADYRLKTEYDHLFSKLRIHSTKILKRVLRKP